MKKLFGWLRSEKVKDNDQLKGPEFDVVSLPDGSTSFKLADKRQVINSVTQLRLSNIDEMVARQHDLEYQLALTRSIIVERSILPFTFKRSVILLRKAKRYHEELEICNYLADYCKKAEASWDGESAMVWKGVEECVRGYQKFKS